MKTTTAVWPGCFNRDRSPNRRSCRRVGMGPRPLDPGGAFVSERHLRPHPERPRACQPVTCHEVSAASPLAPSGYGRCSERQCPDVGFGVPLLNVRGGAQAPAAQALSRGGAEMSALTGPASLSKAA